MTPKPESPRTRRPAREYIAGIDGPSVLVPGWAADWLERQTNLPHVRVGLRGIDPAVDEVLLAIRYVAIQYRQDASSAASSVSGTSVDVDPEPEPALELTHLGVSAAAALIGMSARAVRRAIAEERLAAQQIDGRYLIDRTDALNYRPRNAA
jgi:hypothetical protein